MANRRNDRVGVHDKCANGTRLRHTVVVPGARIEHQKVHTRTDRASAQSRVSEKMCSGEHDRGGGECKGLARQSVPKHYQNGGIQGEENG